MEKLKGISMSVKAVVVIVVGIMIVAALFNVANGVINDSTDSTKDEGTSLGKCIGNVLGSDGEKDCGVFEDSSGSGGGP